MRDFASVLAKIPYARYLGIEYCEANQEFSLPFRDDLVGNPHVPAVHGGALGGFLENSAMIHLCLSEAQARIPKPVDFSIDFLRLAKAQTSFASCEVLRQGRRLAQVQVRCWQTDKTRPVVVGRGHFLLEEA